MTTARFESEKYTDVVVCFFLPSKGGVRVEMMSSHMKTLSVFHITLLFISIIMITLLLLVYLVLI